MARMSFPRKRQKLPHLFRSRLGSHRASFPLHPAVTGESPAHPHSRERAIGSSLDGEVKECVDMFKIVTM